MAEPPASAPLPSPDPTAITTAIIEKEINHLREKLEGYVDGRFADVDSRLTGFGDAQEERMRRLEDLLAERDRRYGERFEAQEKATSTAFEAAEAKVAAAQRASQDAVTKAEVSIEKRADASYVTLNDLQRQLTALMPRSEAEQRIATLGERLNRLEAQQQAVLTREEYDARHKALQEAVSSLASRMDKQEGYSGGANIDRTLQQIKSQVDASTSTIASTAGNRAGGIEARTLMFALAGFGATILGIIVTVMALWPTN